MTVQTAAAPRRPRGAAALAWLPLVAILVVVGHSWAHARGPVPSASGASYIGVTGAVAADIFVDASGCTPAAVDIGDLVPGTDPWKTARDEGGQACAVEFGTTNNLTGTTLSMLEDPAAPAAPADAMKCVGAGCTGSSISDYANSAGEPAAGTEAFGAQLLSTGGIAAGTWNVAPAVYDVQDAASAACTTSAVGSGTCDFTWGAVASMATIPGSYQAQARMVVLAN